MLGAQANIDVRGAVNQYWIHCTNGTIDGLYMYLSVKYQSGKKRFLHLDNLKVQKTGDQWQEMGSITDLGYESISYCVAHLRIHLRIIKGHGWHRIYHCCQLNTREPTRVGAWSSGTRQAVVLDNHAPTRGARVSSADIVVDHIILSDFILWLSGHGL